MSWRSIFRRRGSVLANPTQDELKQLVARMPNAQLTEFGNWHVKARVTSRSGGSTFVVTDHPDRTGRPAMPRARYAEIAARQEAWIAEQDMILVEGYIGPENSPPRRPARLFIETAAANIPGMQQQLYSPRMRTGAPRMPSPCSTRRPVRPRAFPRTGW